MNPISLETTQNTKSNEEIVSFNVWRQENQNKLIENLTSN